MTDHQTVRHYLDGVADVLRALGAGTVERAAALLWDAYRGGRRVVLCGNGGSAATASHFAVDLQKGLPPYGGRPFEAVCLNDSPALLTAWGNDAGFSEAFAGPARTWLRPGDVLVAISGSGNSEDVLRAVAVARETGAVSIGLCGMGGGELARAADLAVVVPGCDLQQAEDAHSVVCHALFRALRDRAAVSSGA